MYKGIFVAGVPGAGCTLMKRLFLAFEDTIAPDCEMFPTQLLVKMQEQEEILVTSRLGATLFAVDLAEEEKEKQVRELRNENVGVLLMTRAFNPKKARVDMQRWSASYSDAFAYWDLIDYTLSYHRLIKEPDIVQVEIANIFDLDIKYHFSEYPDFIDPSTINMPNMPATEFVAGHSLRRIGAPYSTRFGMKPGMTFFQMEEKWKEQNREREVMAGG